MGTFRNSAKVELISADAAELVDEDGGPVVDEAGGTVLSVVGTAAAELVDDDGGPVVDEAGGTMVSVVGTAEDESTCTAENIGHNLCYEEPCSLIKHSSRPTLDFYLTKAIAKSRPIFDIHLSLCYHLLAKSNKMANLRHKQLLGLFLPVLQL